MKPMPEFARALLSLLLALPLAAASPRSAESVREWRDDLAFLRNALITKHPEPFHHLTEAELDRQIATLSAAAPELTDAQIAVRIAAILASLGQGDGHSGVPFPRAGFHFFPLHFREFADGVYLTAAASEDRDFIGSSLVAVNGRPVDEVLQALETITPADNAMSRLAGKTRGLIFPGILEALGLAEGAVTYTFRSAVGPATLTPKPMAMTGPVEWVRWRPVSGDPLYRRNVGPNPFDPFAEGDYFFFEWLADEKLLYVNFSAVANEEDETVSAFFDRVFEFADSHPVEKFVLDIRQNDGGNNGLNRPILHGMIRRADTIGRRGRLFVVTSRETFSAAQNLATLLDIHTDAIFVGEPTGGSPNHFGDAATVTLPNSGLPVRIATLRWQDSDPRDTRPWIAPDVAVDLSFADFFSGHDPVLAAIRAWKPEPALSDRIRVAVLEGGGEAAAKTIAAYRADPRNRWTDVEAVVNRLAYQFAREKKLDSALALLLLNVDLFPDSWNVWDSLGEGYRFLGKTEQAIAAYEKALTLNPEASTAIEALAELRAGAR